MEEFEVLDVGYGRCPKNCSGPLTTFAVEKRKYSDGLFYVGKCSNCGYEETVSDES